MEKICSIIWQAGIERHIGLRSPKISHQKPRLQYKKISSAPGKSDQSSLVARASFYTTGYWTHYNLHYRLLDTLLSTLHTTGHITLQTTGHTTVYLEDFSERNTTHYWRYNNLLVLDTLHSYLLQSTLQYTWNTTVCSTTVHTKVHTTIY